MGSDIEIKNTLPIVDIIIPNDNLGQLLLEGRFVGYHDDRFGVTSGEHQIVMKLLQHEDQFVLFYLHLPYAYPIPDGVKDTVKSALEATLKRTIQKMEFSNSGTESEKNNIQFRVELGGEI